MSKKTYELRNGRLWMILTEAEAANRLRGNSDPAIRWLKGYIPTSSIAARSVWDQRVGKFVRLHVARIVDENIDSVRQSARELTRFVAWQVSQGADLDIEVLLDPSEVERFARALTAGGARSTTVNARRSVLRNLGPSLTSVAPWEPRSSTYQRHKARGPYSPAELRLIDRDAARQATDKRTADARGIKCLCLGAGLDGQWVHRIRGVDVVQIRGTVVVHVPEPMARVVVVRERYAQELLGLAEAAGDGYIVGVGSTSKNAVSRITARIEIDRGRLTLDPRRARTTFMVAHLNAGTHPDVLRNACGLATFDVFRDLYQFMDPVSDADGRRQLRKA